MSDKSNPADPGAPTDLGDGLVLRRGRPQDMEAVAAFNGDIHPDPGMPSPDVSVVAWTQDLMNGQHPLYRAADFTVVEDCRSGRVVSSCCLLDQTWTYAGIPFGVGRPELVGTHPDYRHRGLIAAQFAELHRWSAARGQAVQAITGIPYFYRQFGYEMAVELVGGRWGHVQQAPVLPAGADEPFRVRPAAHDDIPFIMPVVEAANAAWLLACPRDPALWRYEIDGRSAANANRREVRIIESAAGEAVGVLVHTTKVWSKRVIATLAALAPGTSWLAVAPGLVRYLAATGAAYGQRDGEECQGYAFNFGSDHPLYHVIPGLLPGIRPPYTWYLRVADVAGFLRTIGPALEARLAGSPAAGYTGPLTISFYRSGLRLVFAEGRLEAVEPWQPTPKEWGDARFPDLTFLQLLFGYRTLDELRYAFADCATDGDRPAVLLAALFPKQRSHVWPLD